MKRRDARIAAMEIAYRYYLDLIMPGEMEEILKESKGLKLELLSGISDTREYEEISDKYLNKWKFSRLGNIEQAIVVLGIKELMEDNDIPTSVTLNEWIEIAKIYCGEEAKVLVNGVLNKVKDNL